MIRSIHDGAILSFARAGLACALAAAVAGPGQADRFAARGPIIAAAGAPLIARATARPPALRGSLFLNRAEGGLFAALPGRLDAPLRHGGRHAARLRDLIARAEAGPMGYDAVQYGARVKPPKRPTEMTLAELYAWIDATPGQPHAIGRYQFIPPTLRHSAKRLGLPPSTRFSPNVQDRLADLLLGDAGLGMVRGGAITPERFMLNLARIWAGLPTATGRSHYEGYAGNRAVLSWASYSRQVRAILDG